MAAPKTSSPAGNPVGGLSADDLRRFMAEKEAEKASEAQRIAKAREKEQQELHDKFFGNTEITEADRQRFTSTVRRAAERGETEVLAMRFPSTFCADGGRAINNLDPAWPGSLSGRAKIAYDVWEKELKAQGFKLRAEVLDYPGGIIGDIGLYVSW